MKISSKGRNSVRIMWDVAKNSHGAPVRVADIAERACITPKYAEQITGQLCRSGLLKSVRGASGGYVLVKRPDEYTAWEILIKSEGDLSPAECATDYNSCAYAQNCSTQRLWQGLYGAVRAYLEGVTLQDLIDGEGEAGDFYEI